MSQYPWFTVYVYPADMWSNSRPELHQIPAKSGSKLFHCNFCISLFSEEDDLVPLCSFRAVCQIQDGMLQANAAGHRNAFSAEQYRTSIGKVWAYPITDASCHNPNMLWNIQPDSLVAWPKFPAYDIFYHEKPAFPRFHGERERRMTISFLQRGISPDSTPRADAGEP